MTNSNRAAASAVRICAGWPLGLIAAEIQTLLSTTARTAFGPNFLKGERHFPFQFLGRHISGVMALRSFQQR